MCVKCIIVKCTHTHFSDGYSCMSRPIISDYQLCAVGDMNKITPAGEVERCGERHTPPSLPPCLPPSFPASLCLPSIWHETPGQPLVSMFDQTLMRSDHSAPQKIPSTCTRRNCRTHTHTHTQSIVFDHSCPLRESKMFIILVNYA